MQRTRKRCAEIDRVGIAKSQASSAAVQGCATPLNADPLDGGKSSGAEGILESVAEIAVPLTGFAGIVGALAGEKLRPTHPEVWLPFWVMISSSLGIVFAALFPFLPHHLGASDHLVWAASSAFVTAMTACNLAFFMPRILPAVRDGEIPRLRAISVPLDLSSFLVLATQVLNILGVGFQRSAGGFLIGLYLLLLIARLNFVFLLYVLGRTPASPPAV